MFLFYPVESVFFHGDVVRDIGEEENLPQRISIHRASLRTISRRQLKPPRSTTFRYFNLSDGSGGSMRKGLANMSLLHRLHRSDG